MRRLSYAALALAYLQAMLGAFVRITGSGMGCGDHWPRCLGHWVPPMDRVDLVIEVTHRYVAALLTLTILALLVTAWRARGAPGVAGPRGMLRPAAAASVLVVAAALLGAVTVKLELHAGAVLIHLAIAMGLIAALVLAALRASALSTPQSPASPKTRRASVAAAAMAFITVMMGGATANIAAAASSCVGFPHCRSVTATGTPLGVQIVHRVLALLLLLHLLGMVIALRKRAEPVGAKLWAKVALATAVAQILVAAAMVETGLPLQLRLLHQALGTLVWLTAFAFAAVARQGDSA